MDILKINFFLFLIGLFGLIRFILDLFFKLFLSLFFKLLGLVKLNVLFNFIWEIKFINLLEFEVIVISKFWILVGVFIVIWIVGGLLVFIFIILFVLIIFGLFIVGWLGFVGWFGLFGFDFFISLVGIFIVMLVLFMVKLIFNCIFNFGLEGVMLGLFGFLFFFIGFIVILKELLFCRFFVLGFVIV